MSNVSTLKEIFSGNVKQPNKPGSLYEFRQGRVEDLATPNYLRIFHLAVTMPRLWKVPDLKLQMVPEHMAAIGFAEHVDCLDSLLHKQLDWPDVPL